MTSSEVNNTTTERIEIRKKRTKMRGKTKYVYGLIEDNQSIDAKALAQ